MPRLRFRTRVFTDGRMPLVRRLIGSLFVSLIAIGCTQQGPAPDAIPDVPPLDYTIASEVPVGSISTVPGEAIPPPVTAHDPILPSSHTPVPGQPAPVITPVPAPIPQSAAPPVVPQSPARPLTPQEQRMASLELTLLNMSNELAWLRSQPASSTTPWGTPSPKVVPEAPATPQTSQPVAQPQQPAKKLSKTEQAALAAKAEQQTERIATLERNIQIVQTELAELRNQPQNPNPWGTTTPGVAQIQAEAKAAPPPDPIPMSERRPTQTVGVLPAPPQPPAPPAPLTPPAPVVQPVTPPAPVNPDAMTKYPVTVPFAEVADKTIPPPSREAIATPPLKHTRPATSYTPAQPVQPAPRQMTPPPAQTGTSAAATPYGTTTRPSALPQQTTAPAPVKGEKGAYDAAYSAFENKRYNEAWNAFDTYLETYPNGRYAPNALYWKGEVRYSLGDYPGAIILFKDVIARYPRHAKSPDALLKIVMCYNRLQDRDNASMHLRILNEDYPTSEAARRAKRMGLS